jgi:hypothetical protein
MANEIYHRSNWGNAVNDIYWADVYEKYSATNKMYIRSDYYENSNVTDKLMADIYPKPSILLTPTAYDNGSLHSVKPVKTFGSELVTNGDFSDGSTDWINTDNSATFENGYVKIQSQGSTLNRIRQIDVTQAGKTFKLSYKVIENNNVSEFKYYNGTGYVTIASTVGTHEVYFVAGNNDDLFFNVADTNTDDYIKLDNVSVKEVIDADFDFTRGSSATRVNEKGLIEDVQILSGNLVQNGDFSQIGSELIVNGDFATNSNWDLGTGWSINDGKLRADNVSLINTFQAYIYTSGKIYKVTYTISDYVKGDVRFQLGGGGSTVNGATRNANGTYTEYLVATDNHTSARFRALSADGGFTASIDNVSVKEVGQNWSFGTGWNMGDGKAVFSGTDFANLQPSSSLLTIGKKYKLSFYW